MNRTARATLPERKPATQGNDCAERFQVTATGFHGDALMETPGNSISRRCLVEAIEHSTVPHKVLAEEVQQTRSQFSKSLSGLPGGDFNAVLDRIRPLIRLDYARRLADAERDGGLEELAAEDLAHAAIRFLSTRRIRIPLRMAKAGVK